MAVGVDGGEGCGGDTSVLASCPSVRPRRRFWAGENSELSPGLIAYWMFSESAWERIRAPFLHNPSPDYYFPLAE